MSLQWNLIFCISIYFDPESGLWTFKFKINQAPGKDETLNQF